MFPYTNPLIDCMDNACRMRGAPHFFGSQQGEQTQIQQLEKQPMLTPQRDGIYTVFLRHRHSTRRWNMVN